MKKIIFTLLIIALTFIVVQTESSAYMYVPRKPLLEQPQYKKITMDNIKSIKILRYTEGGVNDKEINDKTEIEHLYNYLKQIDIYSETKWGCTDNTTIYVFNLNDGSKEAIEIECNWVILNGKHYLFEFRDTKKYSKILY